MRQTPLRLTRLGQRLASGGGDGVAEATAAAPEGTRQLVRGALGVLGLRGAFTTATGAAAARASATAAGAATARAARSAAFTGRGRAVAGGAVGGAGHGGGGEADR